MASCLNPSRSTEGLSGDGLSLYLDGLHIKAYSLCMMVFRVIGAVIVVKWAASVVTRFTAFVRRRASKLDGREPSKSITRIRR